MRLAFFSPLNPQKSGISDYSEELLPHLAKEADIDLFIDGFKPSNEAILNHFPSFDYRADPESLRRLKSYDAIIYHMGNDPRYHTGIYESMKAFPGITVFHDFAFQFFFFYLARGRGEMRIYLDEVEACHGPSARAAAAEALAQGLTPPHLETPLSFPLNLRLARAAEAIIVHSQWSRSRFEKIVPSTPLAHINLHVIPETTAAATRPQTAAGRARETTVRISSFGHITKEKGIERALRALATLRQRYRFHYTLVGEPSGFFDVDGLVRAYGLKDRVTVTNYVSLEEFKRLVAATDIAVNLRENTVGETSGSLCRIMAAGVPAIVSNVGWFSELPDDSVIKIDDDDCKDALLCAYLERLIEDGSLRARIGENARRYVLSEHNIEHSAQGYLSFAREVVAGRARGRFIQSVSAEIARLGIVNEADEEFTRGIAAEIAMLAPAPAPAKVAAPALESPRAVHTPEMPAGPERQIPAAPSGRLPKIEGVNYKRAALEYPYRLDAGRRHYLLTKPFDNLAKRPLKYAGDGMDVETYRHFCDFANIALTLGLPPESRILDVGCGSGWLAEYFARLGYDVCGIDISPELIEMARERLRRVPFPVDHETPLRHRFQTHDIEAAPLDETFDAVICYDSLHHFEDERAVIRHLAMMLNYGGLLFILEGDRPVEGSRGERELLDEMREYGTLESPFSRDYLQGLLSENGFALVGDYVSVNGLFHRESVKDGRVTVAPPEINYLLCKKVSGKAGAARLPDSRQPTGLRARLSLNEVWEGQARPGAMLKASLTVENTGDALWLVGPANFKGAVMLGIKVTDRANNVAFESHGVPPLPRAMLPGESARLSFELNAPHTPGEYRLTLDLVAQHVCWFEQRGSRPLVLPLRVE